MTAAWIIGGTTVIVVLVAALVLWRGPQPEDTASHRDTMESDMPSEQLYRTADRPAGPDVESTLDPAEPPRLGADDRDDQGRTP